MISLEKPNLQEKYILITDCCRIISADKISRITAKGLVRTDKITKIN